jgi:caa(3)-type oxidase subunit IV
MTTQPGVDGAHDQPHASGSTYLRIAVILFVLTALEVGLYEVSREAGPTGFNGFLRAHFVAILLALSAFKFWCVAMFYMHLKFDLKVLRYVFGFSLFIAVVVISALFTLFTYNRTLWWATGVWK